MRNPFIIIILVLFTAQISNAHIFADSAPSDHCQESSDHKSNTSHPQSDTNHICKTACFNILLNFNSEFKFTLNFYSDKPTDRYHFFVPTSFKDALFRPPLS